MSRTGWRSFWWGFRHPFANKEQREAAVHRIRREEAARDGVYVSERREDGTYSQDTRERTSTRGGPIVCGQCLQPLTKGYCQNSYCAKRGVKVV